ncbi:helix-turn-helix domain-containing protein [Pseudonocardia sp. HH130629-09]|uniref:helix-turn-helix domain-containing protein n=1 Tax=Pseudonocardia sp. HH130629-09 TaxID=1641402 RepID=UPI0009EA6D2E
MRRDVVSLLDDDLLAAWAYELLRPLLTEPGVDDLLTTLEAFLRHHGVLLAASRDLGVHRQTVRTRIARVQHLLGLDLADPVQRANVVIAVSRHRRGRGAASGGTGLPSPGATHGDRPDPAQFGSILVNNRDGLRRDARRGDVARRSGGH